MSVVRINGKGVYTVDPANADRAIGDAIDMLGSNGGVIECFPGDDLWTFTGAIASDKPNVKIRGNGARMRLDGSASAYMFRVRGRDWTIDGVDFSAIASAAIGTTQVKMISVEDAGVPRASNDFSLLNCRFLATLATQAVKNFVCVHVQGHAVTTSLLIRRGLLVQGCTFIAGTNSIPERVVDGDGVPHGITFIKTDASGSQRIVNNVFRGEVGQPTLQNGTELIGGANQTLQVLGSATAGATALNLDSTDATLTGSLQPGSSFTIASDSTNTTHRITKLGVAGGNTVQALFWPPLAEDVADNDAVTLTQTIALGHVASAIVMSDHNQSIVANNSFNLLSCQAAHSGEGGALIHSRGNTGESGHSSIHQNEIEDVDAWYIVRVGKDGGAIPNIWTHCCNNHFGRLIPRVEAVVSYEDAGVANILGNSFHNIGGGPHGAVQTHGYPVHYKNCRTLLMDHSIGSIMDTSEKFYHDGGGNRNIRIGPNNLPDWSY